MILQQGDMWSVYGKTDLFCITTNSYIRKDGCLVMGRGIAKQAVERIPDIAQQFGRMIMKDCGHMGTYGLITWKRRPEQSMAAFQVKRHFKEEADVKLITISTTMLSELATTYSDARFDLNFPGIGFGRLPRDEVLPIIERLPDNVHIWEYAQNR